MKKYVYMIDYSNELGGDQIECCNAKETIEQLKYLIEDKNCLVENVKLVEEKDRWNEEDISFSLAKKIIDMLKYVPKRMTWQKKREKRGSTGFYPPTRYESM